MYELTCPSCKYTVKLSFVRVGASVACEHCGVRYLIGSEHVRRPEAPVAPAARPMPVPPDPADPQRVGDAGQVIGLSGLSEMMKREAVAARRPAAATPGRATPAASGATMPAGGVMRSTWMMLLLLLGVIAVLALSGVLVWYNAQEQPGPRQTPTTQSPP